MLLNGLELLEGQEEKYNTFLSLAAGEISDAELADWIRVRLKMVGRNGKKHLKANSTCIVSLAACAIGLAAVHSISFQLALQDKAAHLTRSDAMWQAVFYDFMVGLPVAALSGWSVATTIKTRRELKARDTE